MCCVPVTADIGSAPSQRRYIYGALSQTIPTGEEYVYSYINFVSCTKFEHLYVLNSHFGQTFMLNLHHEQYTTCDTRILLNLTRQGLQQHCPRAEW